uniref:C2H2-type domain-containing protein n=1 Tax=Salarias fasciatus TaxID=181472 RepID=A0A672FDD2_SALFA
MDYARYDGAALQDQQEAAADGADAPRLQGAGKLSCDVCGLNCISVNVLLVHKRSHTVEKPFKCNHCNRSYKQRSSLEEHRDRCHVYIQNKCPSERADDGHPTRTHMGPERALLLDRLASNVAKRKSSMPQKFTGDNGVCLDLSFNHRNDLKDAPPGLPVPGRDRAAPQPRALPHPADPRRPRRHELRQRPRDGGAPAWRGPPAPGPGRPRAPPARPVQPGAPAQPPAAPPPAAPGGAAGHAGGGRGRAGAGRRVPLRPLPGGVPGLRHVHHPHGLPRLPRPAGVQRVRPPQPRPLRVLLPHSPRRAPPRTEVGHAHRHGQPSHTHTHTHTHTQEHNTHG